MLKPTSAYTKKVLDLFKKPHNYGRMKNPDGIGKVGNPTCGDVMWLYIEVDKKEVIKGIKFETFGCVAAISTSSMITDLAKGKTITQALEITKDNIVGSLGGLPAIKYHCSVLAVDALAEAIYDYLERNKKAIPDSLVQTHKRISQSRKAFNQKK